MTSNSSTASNNDSPFIGVTVLGDYLLSEGPQQVLEKLVACGVRAVTTNPTVTAAAADGIGSFQPPIDGGSSPRLFDRPLFGKRSLWVQSGPSYQPDSKLYATGVYGPRKPNALTGEYGHVIGEFIEAARLAGLEVWLQLGAVQPSGLKDIDRPRLPNGQLASDRMADTGSLASEEIRNYNRAYIKDLYQAYPQINGLRPDWPEYPCYTLNECFHDFSEHVMKSKTVAKSIARAEYSIERIQEEVGEFYDLFDGGLTNRYLENYLESFFDRNDRHRGTSGLNGLYGILPRWPVLEEWRRVKRCLSLETLNVWRETLAEIGDGQLKLSANAFMADYSEITGFHYAQAADVCDAISPKLYTMHWSQMVTFWVEKLKSWNPRLNENLLVAVIATLFDLDDNPRERTLSDFGYPLPDQPHPIADAPQQRKLKRVINDIRGRCQVTPLVHGYGPPDDFARRLKLAMESNCDGVWVNRYGYLSDEKLNTISQWGQPA